jgi:hypothetical protein
MIRPAVEKIAAEQIADDEVGFAASLVVNASSIAEDFGAPQVVIGFTLVVLGTRTGHHRGRYGHVEDRRSLGVLDRVVGHVGVAPGAGPSQEQVYRGCGQQGEHDTGPHCQPDPGQDSEDGYRGGEEKLRGPMTARSRKSTDTTHNPTRTTSSRSTRHLCDTLIL